MATRRRGALFLVAGVVLGLVVESPEASEGSPYCGTLEVVPAHVVRAGGFHCDCGTNGGPDWSIVVDELVVQAGPVRIGVKPSGKGGGSPAGGGGGPTTSGGGAS